MKIREAALDVNEKKIPRPRVTTFPPHTRCYSPSLSGRIAMRCLLSLARLKGRARLVVIRH